MISTNCALSLGKLHSAKWSVYDSKSCAGWWSESAVKNHECCSTRTKNIKVLENSRKDLAPRFFWETPAHSDTKCFAASATCQNSVASSSSRQYTAMDNLLLYKRCHKGRDTIIILVPGWKWAMIWRIYLQRMTLIPS